MGIEIVDYDPRWPAQFEEVAGRLRAAFGEQAVSIDHIGSTSVPGLPAKPIIDAQVTVADFAGAREALLAAGLDLSEYTRDHQPPGAAVPEAQLEKRLAWTRAPIRANVHVRIAGHFNERYALLFRDYLRATPEAAAAYAAIKRALAAIVVDDLDAYYAVKDPVCDLVMGAAELWAAQTGWQPAPHILAAESAGRS
jgi:GrpB-like predicted nucleotidyltransferase (UPF0157 family)